jgi:hypothetical protein
LVPGAGEPANIPVATVKLTPAGSGPASLSVAAGVPVAVTVKVPAVPTRKVVLLALVIAAAWFTVKVKLWVAAGVTPFWAIIVMG